MPESKAEIVCRYLQDAIAAEKTFETQLKEFALEGSNPLVKAAFKEHAETTKSQYERLTARLQELGGTTSTAKSILAHIFGISPKAPSLGHQAAERVAQNVVMAYAVESSERAMYEALITVAEAGGDSKTASLAREIQKEETTFADRVWKLIQPGAIGAYQQVTGEKASQAALRSATA